ncbi:MAG: ankyrin repeat domain-containing protein [Spirochaetales bacterium]|nr:ankyrin repeat domain-containing protein [Spirochaetales bacterium]
MEVLTVFLEEDGNKAETYKKELELLGIKSILFTIPRKWNKASMDLLCEKKYLLLVNNSRLEDESWFFYLSGYLMGKDCAGVIAGEGLKKRSPGSGGWKFIGKLDDFTRYFQLEKAHWDRNEEIRMAGEELSNKGYNLNEDSMVFALFEGDLEAVNLFLTAGFSPEGRDSRGTPLLSIAAGRGFLEIIEVLLKAGAEVDCLSRDRNNTALMDAAAEGRTAAVQMLLDAGAGLEYKSKNGQTAVILAIGQRHVETAVLLLEVGADPLVKDALGMSGAGYAKLFKLDIDESLLEGRGNV